MITFKPIKSCSMHSRQLRKNLSLIWRLLFPISIVLSRLNSKTLTFSFYTMLSKILNIAVFPLILLFLFSWLWDLLSKLNVSTPAGPLQLKDYFLCLKEEAFVRNQMAVDTACTWRLLLHNAHYIVYLQISYMLYFQ